jgi:hypothetical protein
MRAAHVFGEQNPAGIDAQRGDADAKHIVRHPFRAHLEVPR